MLEDLDDQELDQLWPDHPAYAEMDQADRHGRELSEVRARIQAAVETGRAVEMAAEILLTKGTEPKSKESKRAKEAASRLGKAVYTHLSMPDICRLEILNRPWPKPDYAAILVRLHEHVAELERELESAVNCRQSLPAEMGELFERTVLSLLRERHDAAEKLLSKAQRLAESDPDQAAAAAAAAPAEAAPE